MSATTPHTTATASTASRTSITRLDDLAARTAAELADLYAKGTTPAKLMALDGDLRGRMLAVSHLDGRGPGDLVAALARWSGFPWEGKSFRSNGDASGSGINRVALLGRHRLFPFETRIGASVLDGAPCVLLNYDLADNPAAIRAIHDEVREVVPSIYLGPACLKLRASTPVVLWFALEAGARRAS